MSVEPEYLQYGTDWARVVETSDSARIVPPDRPPRVRFFDGPILDRCVGWVGVCIVTGLLAATFHLIRLMVHRWRIRPPTDWFDVGIYAVTTCAQAMPLVVAALLAWLLVVGAVSERCEILVHVTGTVVRRFRGRWEKMAIGRGKLRTLVISGRRPRTGALVIGGISPPSLSLLCDGIARRVELGRYECPLAMDIAQAIIRQHKRLGIEPVPQLLDTFGKDIVITEPDGVPRWHKIKRQGEETHIVAADSPFVPLPFPLSWRIWAVILMVAIALYCIGWITGVSEARTAALIVGCYAGLLTLPIPLWQFSQYRKFSYSIDADSLTATAYRRLGRSTTVIQRKIIAAIRLASDPAGGMRLQAIKQVGGMSTIPSPSVDLAWELAAILRQELRVPVATAEENAIGTGGGEGVSEAIAEPGEHYVQVERRGESIVIHKPALGLRRSSLGFATAALAVASGSICAALFAVPRIADYEARKAVLAVCILALLFSGVLALSIVIDAMESFGFEMSCTHLKMQRRLPWGTRTQTWEYREIRELRIEGISSLVLEDWTGASRVLVAFGHNGSIRYAAALLREHLGEIQES